MHGEELPVPAFPRRPFPPLSRRRPLSSRNGTLCLLLLLLHLSLLLLFLLLILLLLLLLLLPQRQQAGLQRPAQQLHLEPLHREGEPVHRRHATGAW